MNTYKMDYDNEDYLSLSVTSSVEVIHVNLGIACINIARTDEGVEVAIWEPDFLGGEPIASICASESEIDWFRIQHPEEPEA